jgi:hypothetical protein
VVREGVRVEPSAHPQARIRHTGSDDDDDNDDDDDHDNGCR